MVIASLNLCCLMQRKQHLSLPCSPVPPCQSSQKPSQPWGSMRCSQREPHSMAVPPWPSGISIPSPCRVCSSFDPKSCHSQLRFPWQRSPAPAGKSRESTVADLSSCNVSPQPHESLKHSVGRSTNHKGEAFALTKKAFPCQIMDG